MTAKEIASFVVSRWISDHDPASIMLQLICLGHPVRKAEVLAVIREYVRLESENATYGRRK